MEQGKFHCTFAAHGQTGDKVVLFFGRRGKPAVDHGHKFPEEKLLESVAVGKIHPVGVVGVQR